MSTIAELLLARADDDRTAFLHETGRWSFRELVHEGAKRAALFEEVRDPDQPPHIGVLLDNTPDYMFWLTGAALAGAVVVGINSRSEEHTSELQSLMRNSYAVFCL